MKTKPLLLTLLTVAVASILIAYAYSAHLDGKKFCKKFTGYVESVINPVIIKDANTGYEYYNGALPADGVICVETPHRTPVLIQWKDWRGEMEEKHCVLCVDGVDELINDIPYPKSSAGLALPEPFL